MSVSLKVNKIEHRTVTNFFVKDGLTPHEIHSKFIKVYRDSSHSFFRIKKWAAGFKHGRTSLEYDPLEGSPKCATTPEIIEQVHDVLDDWRMKVHEIAETIGITKEQRMCRIYFAWRIGYEKALRKMNATLAHSRSRTHSHENL